MMITFEKLIQKSSPSPPAPCTTLAFCGRCATNSSAPPPTYWWPKTAQACPSPRSPTSVPAPPDVRGSDASRSLGRGGRSPPREAPQVPLPPHPGWGPKAASRGGWRGTYGAQRDALCVHRYRAFDALFAPVHGASSGLLSSARSLGDTAVYGYVRKLQADDPIVDLLNDALECVHRPGFYPLIASAS